MKRGGVSDEVADHLERALAAGEREKDQHIRAALQHLYLNDETGDAVEGGGPSTHTTGRVGSDERR